MLGSSRKNQGPATVAKGALLAVYRMLVESGRHGKTSSWDGATDKAPIHYGRALISCSNQDIETVSVSEVGDSVLKDSELQRDVARCLPNATVGPSLQPETC